MANTSETVFRMEINSFGFYIKQVFDCERWVFCLKSSGELRSAERGDSPRPRRGKRVDTKVSTLLTPTSFWEGLAQITDM